MNWNHCYPVYDLREHKLDGSDTLPVTEQEEEAWLDKMQKLAGCVA